jgi:hypothetical protein
VSQSFGYIPKRKQDFLKLKHLVKGLEENYPQSQGTTKRTIRREERK